MGAADLQSLFGLLSYFKRSIPNFAQVAASQQSLTLKNAKFRCTKYCEDAFEVLKRSLVTSHILAYPDFWLPFLVQTDASNFAVGASYLSYTKDWREWLFMDIKL